MRLTLNVYTDETFTEIEKTLEADSLVIPYRVAMYIGQSLDTINFDNTDDLYKLAINSLDKIDKIIKATFKISNSELDRVNVVELGSVAMELYKWGLDKFNGMKGDNEKNVSPTAII